jgi:hypothetical protein
MELEVQADQTLYLTLQPLVHLLGVLLLLEAARLARKIHQVTQDCLAVLVEELQYQVLVLLLAVQEFPAKETLVEMEITQAQIMVVAVAVVLAR